MPTSIEIPTLKQETAKGPEALKAYLRGGEKDALDVRLKRIDEAVKLMRQLEKGEQNLVRASCNDLLKDLRKETTEKKDEKVNADIASLEKKVNERLEEKKTLMEQAKELSDKGLDKAKELGGKGLDQAKETGKDALDAIGKIDTKEEYLLAGGAVAGTVIAGQFLLPRLWNKFKSLFTKKPAEEKPDPNAPSGFKKYIVNPLLTGATAIGAIWLWNRFKGDFGLGGGGNGAGTGDKPGNDKDKGKPADKPAVKPKDEKPKEREKEPIDPSLVTINVLGPGWKLADEEKGKYFQLNGTGPALSIDEVMQKIPDKTGLTVSLIFTEHSSSDRSGIVLELKARLGKSGKVKHWSETRLAHSSRETLAPREGEWNASPDRHVSYFRKGATLYCYDQTFPLHIEYKTVSGNFTNPLSRRPEGIKAPGLPLPQKLTEFVAKIKQTSDGKQWKNLGGEFPRWYLSDGKDVYQTTNRIGGRIYEKLNPEDGVWEQIDPKTVSLPEFKND